jgi:hypothetical protein
MAGGGGGGIRTRETIHHRLHTFQACAFNRSATPPRRAPAGSRGRRRLEQDAIKWKREFPFAAPIHLPIL